MSYNFNPTDVLNILKSEYLYKYISMYCNMYMQDVFLREIVQIIYFVFYLLMIKITFYGTVSVSLKILNPVPGGKLDMENPVHKKC